MYDNKNVFCFILARGGSKGVPRKNLKLLSNKPLIAHSIDLAKKIKYIDRIFVSTEDKEIKDVSMSYGATVIDRPTELATDTADYLDAIKHMITKIPNSDNTDIVVLLETTCPLREKNDVKKCIEMIDENTDCIAGIAEVKVHPAYMYRKKNELLMPLENFIPKKRQELEKLYSYTGSILVTSIGFLKNQKYTPFGGRMKGYLLGEKQSLDIDTSLDFEICDFLMKKYFESESN